MPHFFEPRSPLKSARKPLIWLTIAVAALLTCRRVIFRYEIIKLMSDQVSHIPLVLHLLDPSVLATDWYVERMSEFTVRTIYAFFLGGLSKILGVDAGLLLVHILAHAAAVYASWHLAVRTLGGGTLAGLLAIAVVVLVAGPTFDQNSLAIMSDSARPKDLAKALTCLAIAFAFRRQGRAVLICLCAAAAIQLAYPLWMGLAILAAWTATAFAQERQIEATIAAGLAATILAVFGVPVIAALAAEWIGPPDEGLVHIVATLRNPHHFFIDGWETSDIVRAVALVIATLVLIGTFGLRRDSDDHRWFRRVAICLCVAVVCYALVGLALVTAFPSKVGLALQGFRYGYIVFWLFLVLLSVRLASLIAFAWQQLPAGFRKATESTAKRVDHPATAAMAIALALAFLFVPLSSNRVAHAVHDVTRYVPSLALYREVGRYDRKGRLRQNIADLIEMSSRVKQSVPADGIVLTPPGFGILRVLSERSLVVGFKSWPFGHAEEWFARMEAVYGTAEGRRGFDWMHAMDLNYRAYGCDDIKRIAERFEATHAVVYHGSGTARCGGEVARAGSLTLLAISPAE